MNIKKYGQDLGQAFRNDRRGTVGIIFGLSFIPAIMVMGVAIDYRNAAVLRSRMQAATDAASVAVAQSLPNLTQSARQQIAQNFIHAQLGDDVIRRGNVVVTESEPLAGRFRVQATASVPTTVMKFAQFDVINIAVTSTANAVSVDSGGGGCVLSLNESAVNSVWYNGRAEVRLTQ